MAMPPTRQHLDSVKLESAHRTRDVPEMERPEIGENRVRLAQDLVRHRLGHDHSARFGIGLEPGSGVDAVAQHLAIGTVHHVAEVQGDPQLYLRPGLDAKNGCILRIHGPAECVQHAAELNKHSVAGPAHHPAPPGHHPRLDDRALHRQPFTKRGFVVPTHQARIADHIQERDRSQAPLQWRVGSVDAEHLSLALAIRRHCRAHR